MQGLSGKELELELFNKKHNVHVLCLTEHWLRVSELASNNACYSIGSAFCRKKANHGGAMIIVSNIIKCKNRKDINNLSIERCIEISCVELEQFIVLCVYRPPLSEFNLFESTMDDVLGKLMKSCKNIIVCGDFNVNLLECSGNNTRLVSLFASFGLRHLFLEPTRITSHSATCLDNIFCNCEYLHKDIFSELPSDHCGQKATFAMNMPKITSKFSCRPITQNGLKQFESVVANRVTSLDHALGDPNELYHSLLNIIESEHKSIFKIKTFKLIFKIKTY